MKKRTVARFLIMSTLFVLIGACAKISNPSGGPRDRTPPVVLETIPQYGARNFKGKSITITFDEYVALDNINEKFMVSPPMKKKPKVFIRSKNVIVEFAGTSAGTAQHIPFIFRMPSGTLMRGISIEDYQFVLSTGSVIDSLSVTGNVYNAFRS